MFRYLRQLASESLIYGLSGVITRFVGLFLVPVYTRLFAPEDYGVIGLVTTTMSLLATFVVLGLDSATIRWYWDTSDVRDRKSSVGSWIWCQIAVSLLFTLAMIALSGWLADDVVHRPDARLYFILAAVCLPLNTWTTVVTNWLRLQRHAWTTVAFSLGISLAGIAAAFLLVVGLRWGLRGIYISQLCVALLATAAAIVILKDWAHPRHFRPERLRVMLRYALPLIPTGIAVWAISVSDRYFVQYYQTTSEVGLYQIAGSIALGMALLTTAFQQAWGPFAMSIYKHGDATAVYARVLFGQRLVLLTDRDRPVITDARVDPDSGHSALCRRQLRRSVFGLWVHNARAVQYCCYRSNYREEDTPSWSSFCHRSRGEHRPEFPLDTRDGEGRSSHLHPGLGTRSCLSMSSINLGIFIASHIASGRPSGSSRSRL